MNSTSNKSFKQECKIINLATEYKGYTGTEQYAIVTDLSEEELNSRYGEEIKPYRPFVILTRQMGLAIRIHQRNEERYKKRNARGTRMITCNEEDESLIGGLAVDDEQTVREAEEEDAEVTKRINAVSKKALVELTALQRKYLIRHFVDKKSYREIAKEEGKSKETIRIVCKAALKKYIKAVKKLEVQS